MENRIIRKIQMYFRAENLDGKNLKDFDIMM